MALNDKKKIRFVASPQVESHYRHTQKGQGYLHALVTCKVTCNRWFAMASRMFAHGCPNDSFIDFANK